MRELTTNLASLLVAASLIGCGDRTRAIQQETPTLAKGQASQTNPKSVAAESGEARSPSIEPSRAMLGTWQFDPEAMRKTSEFRQQIELLESRGYSRHDASKRAESSFATLSAMRYVFTGQTFSIGKQDVYKTVAYSIVSETEDTVVTKTTESKKADGRTTIRVVDVDHLVISDDSRPDVPVWTFKRTFD